LASVSPVTSWWLDLGKGREVQIDDGFERIACGAALQVVWQRREPAGIFSLRNCSPLSSMTFS